MNKEREIVQNNIKGKVEAATDTSKRDSLQQREASKSLNDVANKNNNCIKKKTCSCKLRERKPIVV